MTAPVKLDAEQISAIKADRRPLLHISRQYGIGNERIMAIKDGRPQRVIVAHLDPAIIAAIRADKRTNQEIAAAHKLSVSSVTKIRNGAAPCRARPAKKVYETERTVDEERVIVGRVLLMAWPALAMSVGEVARTIGYKGGAVGRVLAHMARTGQIARRPDASGNYLYLPLSAEEVHPVQAYINSRYGWGRG
jgi:hypothetical protein